MITYFRVKYEWSCLRSTDSDILKFHVPGSWSFIGTEQRQP